VKYIPSFINHIGQDVKKIGGGISYTISPSQLLPWMQISSTAIFFRNTPHPNHPPAKKKEKKRELVQLQIADNIGQNTFAITGNFSKANITSFSHVILKLHFKVNARPH